MKLIKNKGQTLTELAIFGSVLLFCVAMLIQYALEANYQQQVQMEAFRKAQKIAFYKSGPAAATSLLLVKDKPIPDTRDQFGFAERYPIVGGDSVVWDTNLSAQYVKKFADTPDVKDLPATYFEIDKASNLSEVKSKARAEVPSGAGEDKVFGFYNARFDKRPCPDEIVVVFEDPTHKNPANPEHREYFTVKVPKAEIKVMRIEMKGGFGGEIDVDDDISDDTELLMYPYFRYKGLKYRITDADVDGDGKLETIIAANKNKDLFYIDSHDVKNPTASGTVAGEIQIDTDYVQVYPWDKDKTLEDKQGMIQDLKKTTTLSNGSPSKIVKTENKGSITSTTTLNAKQVIYHKVRLNDGQVVEIPAQFTVNKSDLYNWK